jgi:predicted RNase H-like nuclease (RuvC/YqgF family)
LGWKSLLAELGVPMEELDKLREERKQAYQELIHSSSMMIRARSLFQSLEKRYLHDKKVWETLDRQLAMLDGRFKVEEPGPVKKVHSKEHLTIEQIERLAKEFGVEL